MIDTASGKPLFPAYGVKRFRSDSGKRISVGFIGEVLQATPSIVTPSGVAGLTFLNEVWFATVGQIIPADVLARANSFDWLLSLVAMPAGFAIWGPVADHAGIPTTLVAAAIILALPSFLIVLHPAVRSVRRTPEGLIVAGA